MDNYENRLDNVPEGGTVRAVEFAALEWAHVETNIATLQETVAYTGTTVWEAPFKDQRFRMQWEWMFEPYFQRPFTIDMRPRSNAIFADGDMLDFALPVDPRVRTLRATIDRIDWQATVLDELYKKDAALKHRVDKLLKGLSADDDTDA